MLKKLFIFSLIIFLFGLQWFDLNSKLLANRELINNNVPTEIIEHEIETPNVIEPIIIVIDPGHGPKVNSDMEPISPDSSVMKRKYGTGAVGNVTGTMEREINLNVSLMLRDLLEKDGFVVIMTRTNHDVISSNIDRVNLANDNNADLMIRVHSDSHTDTSIHGASMLVPGEVGYATPIVDISRKYGEIVLNTLVDKIGMANRGVVTRTDQTGFNWSKIPIITVEMGFLSNPEEDKLLSTSEYQEKLAFALYKGISNCFKTE